MSRGRYVALLNPDILLRGEIADILRPLEADPLAGCVGCRCRAEPDGGIQESCHEKFPTPWSEFLEGMSMDRLWRRVSGSKPAHETCAGVREVAWIIGACMFFRREVLLDLGGFDERYYIYGEDVDLSLPVETEGIQGLFVGTVEMLHHHGASSQKTGTETFFLRHAEGVDVPVDDPASRGPDGFSTGRYGCVCSVFRIFLLGFSLRSFGHFPEGEKKDLSLPSGEISQDLPLGTGAGAVGESPGGGMTASPNP